MKNYLLIFFTLLFFVHNIFSQTSSATMKDEEQLRKSAEQVTVDEIEKFDSAYEYIPIPTDSTDYRGIAIVYLAKEEYQLAVNKINEELNVNPSNPKALNLRGYSYNELGKYSLALKDLNKAIAIESDNPVYHYNRGISYHKLGQYELSIEDYSKTIALEVDNDKAYYNRAISYGKLRMFKKAIKDYNRDLEINGEAAKTYNNRGRCYMILNKNNKALQDYNKALELEPNRIITIGNKGVLYFRQGDSENGCVQLELAKSLGETNNSLLDEYCN